MKNLFIFLIDIYRVCVSPFTQPSCRFYPSCSYYARESFIQHGAFRGLLLTSKRLVRCHPFCEGGFDPVPPKKKSGY
ncbi:MAG: membrane protein insertion efficiency factor YidD [Deltaproteobacteria bacterium]|nr:membrane protein insertion efficiency factor YidD [Deltaproteobacteria bacterium]MCW8893455.1 membrane protein insertion efficiency factor YidD [Deltaproteobacteria bacterium]MCW9049974.1 membrane protein insertion efficiency factor YidD [Deltaproteobacteria bacterium]